MEEFAYFMIRLRRPPPDASTQVVSGMVERLDTGEKWSFSGTDELLRLMSVPPHSGNMQPPGASGKPG